MVRVVPVHVVWLLRAPRLVAMAWLAGLAVAASAQVYLPAIGGGGGVQFRAPCPPGTHLNGIELRVGDDVDAARPLCVRSYGPNEFTGPALTTDSGLVQLTPRPGEPLALYGVAPGWYGGIGGDIQALQCPAAAPIVIGINVAAEGVDTIVVNNVHLFCGQAIAAQTAAENPSAILDAPGYRPSAGWLGIGATGASGKLVTGSQRCPFGQVAVGLHGRSGRWLDSVGLICAAPAVVERPSAPARPKLTLTLMDNNSLGGTNSAAGRQAMLVEWSAAPRETEAAVESYTTEIFKSGRWSPIWRPILMGGMLHYKASVGAPFFTSVNERYAFRVCAANRFHSSCSKQTWHYGRPVSQQVTAAVITSGYAAPVPVDAAILYGIDRAGVLKWFRHNAAASGAGADVAGAWAPSKDVGRGWDALRQVFAGGAGVIYGITGDGKLMWYRHAGYFHGHGLNVPGAWLAAQEVSAGWGDYKHVFSAGNGILYAVTHEGLLLWFRHRGVATGGGELDGPVQVAADWGDYEQVFAAGDGIIYGISADGSLRWHAHQGHQDGTDRWSVTRAVGRGWSGLRQAVSAGRGVIYAVRADGVLRWFKHNGHWDGRGLETPGAWEPSRDVGRGWNALTGVVAQF